MSAPKTIDDLGGWPGVLALLSARSDLTAAEAYAALGDILAGNASAAQLAAFIFGLRCKGETTEELTGLVRAMSDAASQVEVPEVMKGKLVDTCGTGGDRSGTINVSTIAALVVAGAGVPVCKHGGRAASSRAGSADLLEALGVAIDLDGVGVGRCLKEANIGFCFAPRFHPSMRYAIPVRRELGVQTAFNLLGPLANPARVSRQVVGVGDRRMASKMASVLGANGATKAMVVFGEDGLDELSTTGPSTVVEWDAGAGAGGIRRYTVEPERLGLGLAQLDELKGGDAAANAVFARRVLGGEAGAHRDIVVLNAAAGLLAGGAVSDLPAGVAAAAAAIDDGRAQVALDRLIEVSRAAAGSSQG